ncbi:hypothetical protein Tco_1315416 [Tanacetum coccineum]
MPDVYISFIKQFWRSAKVTTDDNGEVQITATIDGHSMTITEASLRRHLKLDDHDGITFIPNLEIFEQLALVGYHTDSDKLTFQKGAFSPQWRFLIHTILHCISPKKTTWEQFSSNIATAVICLATNKRYNFSRIRVLEDDLKKTKQSYSSAFTKLILRVKKLVEFNQDEESKEKKLGLSFRVKEFTAGRTVTYRRRSEEKRTRKDKGKAIMTEPEPKKKSKKELEQERLSLAEAIRLQEQMDEAQKAHIARDEEIARQ